MKKILFLTLILLAAVLALAGCNSHKETQAGGSRETAVRDNASGGEVFEPDAFEEDGAAVAGASDKGAGGQAAEEAPFRSRSRILVVYFSMAGDQYKVGRITKGNTEIVAKMIADEADADIFRVEPVNDNYDTGYKQLTEIAKKEQTAGARPKYRGKVDFSGCDTVFFGAPVWWGDWPMIMYSFFEDHAAALKGKTLIPFCTHEGSGLSGFDKKLQKAVPGARVVSGFEIKGSDAQNRREYTEDRVEDWIDRMHIDD